MNLRDWIRQHTTLHRVVHATWCRAVAPFDTRRAVSSTGGGVLPPPTDTTLYYIIYTASGIASFQTIDQVGAQYWIKVYGGSIQTHVGLTSTIQVNNDLPQPPPPPVTTNAPYTIPTTAKATITLATSSLGQLQTTTMAVDTSALVAVIAAWNQDGWYETSVQPYPN